MKENIREIYQSRVSRFSDQSIKTGRQNKYISLLRLFVFISGVFLIYFFSGVSVPAVIITSVVFIALFIAVIKIHIKRISKKRFIDSLLKINKDEISALDGNIECFDGGKEFLDPDHPYVSDLDIFGDGSLFQFLNRTSTRRGKEVLADWFLNPELKKNIILDKQKAVDDLNGKLEWRQRFLAVAKDFADNNNEQNELVKWSASKPIFRSKIYDYIIVILPVLTLTLIILNAFCLIPFAALLLYSVIPVLVVIFHLKTSNEQHRTLSKKAELLQKYSSLLLLIENMDFSSEQLKRMKSMLVSDKVFASAAIKQLSKILNAFDSRLNLLAGFILNYFFLWDIVQIKRLNKWKNLYKESIPYWFDVLNHFDAYISLSNYAFNHAEDVYPVINDNGYLVKTKSAGHPMIPADIRVYNEIIIKDKQTFMIVTGANMAGKSTYLRTIGINMIMAMIGMPVCSDNFECKPVRLYSSMRTRDSLYKNESYFYAELKRLQCIIEELEKGEELFILLDEILKGTNSKDKQSGSRALVSKLIRLNAAGVIATHDLVLGEMEDLFPEQIKNFCFEVDIIDDSLEFDYMLRAGISQNLNATFLMEKMKITL